uniref:Coiled-coil domain containing 92 n=1 Tax=Aotus nancymaae TaxID=37293 RepID=A0A2K5D0V1_AOTNA
MCYGGMGKGVWGNRGCPLTPGSIAAADIFCCSHAHLSCCQTLLCLSRTHWPIMGIGFAFSKLMKILKCTVTELMCNISLLDLTYELTLKSSEQTGDGTSRSSELKKRCEELEVQLKVKEKENAELLKELEQKNAMITVLENTIKEREKKYLEELKAKSHKLTLLSSELEQRAGTIAYLTSQLHAAKKKLMSSSGTSDASPSGSPVLASYKPAPPKDKLPETPRRRMKKSLSAPLHPEFEEVYRFGAESRKLLLREPVDAMPDPTPFLLARESAEVHLIKERPLVIPPIASDRSSEQHSPAREKPHKAHVGVAHRIHHAAPPQAQPEVETLTVDQVNGGKVVRKHSGTDRTV